MPRGQKLELKQRAERMDETHRRIAKATYELHATIGPMATTVSAVAERAGVQRLTVYRHYPAERDLHQACVEYAFSLDPPPDFSQWADIVNPRQRLEAALPELYAFFARNEGLLRNATREIPLVMPRFEGNPPEALLAFTRLPGQMRDVLAAGWNADDPAMLAAALALAVEFSTWDRLVREQGLSNAEAAGLMLTLVECLASRSGD